MELMDSGWVSIHKYAGVVYEVYLATFGELYGRWGFATILYPNIGNALLYSCSNGTLGGRLWGYHHKGRHFGRQQLNCLKAFHSANGIGIRIYWNYLVALSPEVFEEDVAKLTTFTRHPHHCNCLLAEDEVDDGFCIHF